MHVATKPWFPDRSRKYWGDHSWRFEVPVCHHTAHDPPNMMVFPEGEYRHRCPGCGVETIVVTERPW